MDVQLRSLCTGKDDLRGLELLECMISWLTQELVGGKDFEVLQAYLHRFLFIYEDMLLGVPHLRDRMQALCSAQDHCSRRFRDMIQSNLCVLKVMAQIPSI